MQICATTELLINVLGVTYVHKKTPDGGDIYLTQFGLEWADLLEIKNWYEKEWSESKRERLEGTGAVFRLPTKEVNGQSIDLVVKNCRVGEDVLLEKKVLMEFINAEFNSPWEEFALVMEMRAGRHGPREVNMNTQEPLAIYVPPEKLQHWQTGRSQEKINRIRARHPGITLDILRQYKLVYRWITGKDCVAICDDCGLSDDDRRRNLTMVTKKAIADMEGKGFLMVDMKPSHVIIREEDRQALMRVGQDSGGAGCKAQLDFMHRLIREGHYSVIDYELLQRTAAHQEEVSEQRRRVYLIAQRHRFAATLVPAHLKQMEVFDIPYMVGHAESTGGTLWVVGRNAQLFDYFLPERWRKTPCWLLPGTEETYYTITKDNVHLVWKTSCVGEAPSADGHNGVAAVQRGFNSPFEEFAIARFLNDNGVPTVYVRAIYMTGSRKMEPSTDLSRYESHRGLRGLDGDPLLRDDRNYITLRGYYRGADDWVATHDGRLFGRMDLLQAQASGIIDSSMYDKLFDATRERLRNLGYDGALLGGTDLILSVHPDGDVVQDEERLPEVRVCNFELIQKL